MKYLLHSDDAACYGLDPAGSPTRVLICSTAASRTLLTDPAVSGHRYRSLLGTAVSTALDLVAEADPAVAGALATEATTVVTILRGGLSFGVDSALSHRFGSPEAVSFVGTDRGAAHPLDISYERWEFAGRQLLVLGDIIGTGATVEKVLRAARQAAHGRGAEIAGYLVLTVGSRQGVRRLRDYFAELAHRGERFSAVIVALEALFELPDRTRLGQSFPQLPFDFLRSPRWSTPDFELHRLGRRDSLFEKCAVYDGGVRAFTPGEHRRFRADWWTEVRRRGSAAGLSLADLGRSTAGLDRYARPLDDWLEGIGWAAPETVRHLGVDHAELHALGRRAHEYAETASLDAYADARLAPGEPPR
ncbi:phosphoribosyltransferase [Kitasatospora sp. NPDC001261]|uniref:phosphoribosyltransferase n=1 Tax=Kitasatospora sp. NPDC001261 TaxID=3364012 RepID=UPI0036AD53B9